MFTHPALLRQLNLAAEFLRAGGEKQWARTVVRAADEVRRHGWTEAGRGEVAGLFERDEPFDAVAFGSQHGRWLGNEKMVRQANARLSEMRARIRELMMQETREAPARKDRRRSPDLEPLAEKGPEK